MRQLHLLRLLTNHHQQHYAEQNTGCDEHPAVGQFLLKDERQYGDDRRQGKPEQRALENNTATKPEMISLQEQHDFESLAVKRSKSEQDQANDERALRRFAAVAILEQAFAAAIMGADPAAPVNFVEEPVHYDQQNNHCEQSGGGLQIERAHVV